MNGRPNRGRSLSHHRHHLYLKHGKIHQALQYKSYDVLQKTMYTT